MYGVVVLLIVENCVNFSVVLWVPHFAFHDATIQKLTFDDIRPIHCTPHPIYLRFIVPYVVRYI